MDKPETISVREAAEVLGISGTHAYNLVRRGEFPVTPIRAGRSIRIPRVQLEAILEKGAA